MLFIVGTLLLSLQLQIFDCRTLGAKMNNAASWIFCRFLPPPWKPFNRITWLRHDDPTFRIWRKY